MIAFELEHGLVLAAKARMQAHTERSSVEARISVGSVEARTRVGSVEARKGRLVAWRRI